MINTSSTTEQKAMATDKTAKEILKHIRKAVRQALAAKKKQPKKLERK